MESALLARDVVGVQDFVLLEDYTNVKAFLENLRKRYNENLVYTCIGPVLIFVNPYKPIDIYNPAVMQTYHNYNFFELPPHVFAVTDIAYQSMRREGKDQCILISGESGAGKTEASKQIMSYIAANSGHHSHVDRVKDRLLQSNPILESFGNAKTTRNDNSSRFGKYMDIQFDYTGAPVGGVIRNYLLEKSRVVCQASGERNFHVFYQLLNGGNHALLDQLHLTNNVEQYQYVKPTHAEDNGVSLSEPDRQKSFQELKHALEICDFSETEKMSIFSIISFILHLGNLMFIKDRDVGKLKVVADDSLAAAVKMLGCDVEVLTTALTTRSIFAEQKKVVTPLSRDQAVYARDALAKGVYERLFVYIVEKINNSLTRQNRSDRVTILGVLDIYGFEILRRNSFEQFCINLCNEKLQQVFITLTLHSEQQEYISEGIEWEQIDYFNNKIICDLIECKPRGIIALLDDECNRPGNQSDENFLENLSSEFGNHAHFYSHRTASQLARKTIQRNEFCIQHYAGSVVYDVKGFVDKNKDLLYRDLKEAMQKSKNTLLNQFFPASDLIDKKRPESAGTHFKLSLQQLMEILMSKEPSYIRCIKPNDFKKSNDFNLEIVEHQVKYLGLMENLRVRRAGFAYRRPYEYFLRRYKSLCPATWPTYTGSAHDGVRLLCEHLNYQPNEYRMGRTKLFIRFPRVLFATEESLQRRKHELASKIQANYRRFYQRRIYLNIRADIITCQSVVRMFIAKRELVRRRNAYKKIGRYLHGYITRNGEPNENNRMFLSYMKYNYLMRLKDHLPKSVLDRYWPPAPQRLQETSKLLHSLCIRNLGRRYRLGITPERKDQFEQKIEAEEIFKGKKDSYPFSIGEPFVKNRLDKSSKTLCDAAFNTKLKQPGEEMKYCTLITKYDRHGYQARKRVLVISNRAVYVLNCKDFKLKQKILFSVITEISVSSFTDNFFVIHTDATAGTETVENGKNGKTKVTDWIYETENAIELLVKLFRAMGRRNLKIVSKTITCNISKEKQGYVDFNTGSEVNVVKKKRRLSVVAYTPQVFAARAESTMSL